MRPGAVCCDAMRLHEKGWKEKLGVHFYRARKARRRDSYDTLSRRRLYVSRSKLSPNPLAHSVAEWMTALDSSYLYKIGDRVLATCDGWSKSYPGKIQSLVDGGKYSVRFDDGDLRNDILENDIELDSSGCVFRLVPLLPGVLPRLPLATAASHPRPQTEQATTTTGQRTPRATALKRSVPGGQSTTQEIFLASTATALSTFDLMTAIPSPRWIRAA